MPEKDRRRALDRESLYFTWLPKFWVGCGEWYPTYPALSGYSTRIVPIPFGLWSLEKRYPSYQSVGYG